MIKMTKDRLFFLFDLLLAIVVVGCSRSNEDAGGKIPVDFTNSVSPLAKIVNSIEFVPLENDGEHLLGTTVDLMVMDDSYIVTDYLNGNIFRYSLDGHFVNNIGRRGNGPEEYVHINDVQYRDSVVYVFSVPSKIQRFALDGIMIDSEVMDEMELGAMSWVTNDGILSYYGYGTGRKGRFSLFSENSSEDFYPSEEKVLNYTPSGQIFSESHDSVFVVDSYSDIIKVYSGGTMTDGPCFNFGKYSIPKSFYEYDDSFMAMDSLLGSEFAMINRYVCDGDRRFVSLTLQKQGEPYTYCGLYLNGQWSWFYAGKVGTDAMSNACQSLKGGVLYCLFDPSLMSTFPASLKKLVTNSEVLDDLDSDDNCIIAKMTLM